MAPDPTERIMEAPSEHLAERCSDEGVVRKVSVYTEARLHPVIAGTLLASTGFVPSRIFGGGRRRRARPALAKNRALPGPAKGQSSFGNLTIGFSRLSLERVQGSALA